MPNTEQRNVLLFAEDPGAANYLVPMLPHFESHGVAASLFACGPALSYLAQHGLPHRPWLRKMGAAEELLASAKPDLVIVGTSENKDGIGLHLVPLCRERGIPVIGAVDAFMNAAHRFKGNTDKTLAYAPDLLLVADPWTKDEYVRIGFDAQKIIICGHPMYERLDSEKARLDKEGRETVMRRVCPLAGDRKVLVFMAELSGGLQAREFMRSADYTLPGRGGSDKRTNIIFEELLDALKEVSPRPFLVLRLSPKNSLDEFAAYTGEFDFISEGGNHLEIIYLADAVVGMTSTAMLEAAALGRPALSILPRESEKKWLPALAQGYLPCVCTRDALRRALPGLLSRDSAFLSPPRLAEILEFRFPEEILRKGF
ncbi:MAG: hypothetical protein A2X49_03540 [Lentisphaerae bacterium GWF2_52_8]|nr:MAG: hypothetical protein A2X49_03540 [Lentisphaerae bacterium GWF2_52_8]